MNSGSFGKKFRKELISDMIKNSFLGKKFKRELYYNLEQLLNKQTSVYDLRDGSLEKYLGTLEGY